jgi:hypothetical protein
MPTRFACIWRSLSLLVALVASGHAAEVPICSIIANPKSFDHQNVSLQGTIGSLRETTSRKGNDYTTFKLQDPSVVLVIDSTGLQHELLKHQRSSWWRYFADIPVSAISVSELAFL